MGYRASAFGQDASVGRVDQMLECIGATAADVPDFDIVDAAVAYASRRGVDLLCARLSSSPTWESATKRFLISIDFGITHPQALSQFEQLNDTEVRVPNAATVLASARFMPPSTFHAKTYRFGRSGSRYPCGIAIGSANLTASALLTSSEVFASHVWTGTVSRSERLIYNGFRPVTEWFEDAWARATPLSTVLPAYEVKFKTNRFRRPPSEDVTKSVRTYLSAPGGVEISGELAVQLQAAKTLWIKTNKLYGNLREGTLGNQLDTPRGTRLFFGFPTKNEAKNTILGYVELQAVGHAAVKRSIRFADNQMDKINLPVPGSDGPSTYDNSYLVFDRAGTAASGLALFMLTVTDLEGIKGRRARAANTVDLEMAGGRPYGLMF